MEWFRFYHEFVDDPKIAMMPDSDQLLWVKALCLASNSKQRGKILLTDEEICWKLRVSMEQWRQAVDKFLAKGIIERNQSGYRIVDWDFNQRHKDRLPSREWRELRVKIFERDNYTCQYCGAQGVPLECDHIFPISRGGTNHPDNLATACRQCNQSKHNKTPQEWLGGAS